MGWIDALIDTYDRCKSEVGKRDVDGNILLPMVHSIADAQIEIRIEMDGTFLSANTVEKEDTATLIPVTEDSGTKGNGIAPHPLCDELCYIAGDYHIFVQSEKNKNECYGQYIKALEEWSRQPQVNDKVKAIFQYLRKGNTINDLIAEKVLQTDENGYINGIKLGNISQEDAFVRFIVEKPMAQNYIAKVWEDRELFQEYERYYMTQKAQKKEDIAFCYVIGEMLPSSDKHPAKIRHTGDMAKIISSKSSNNNFFTYRGRFSEAKQAVSISFLASQRAHSALRWLVQKQGYHIGSEVIVSWCVEGKIMPNPLANTMGIIPKLPDEDPNEVNVDTGLNYAARLNRAIAGYRTDLATDSKVVVMSVDTANGSLKGRLSITFFCELRGTEFLDNLQMWHQECYWKHRYKKENNKYISFVGAPSPREIANSAYGTEQKGKLETDEKILKNCIKRILPCIIQKKIFPYDIVKAMVYNVGRPMRMKGDNFNRLLSNTCAVIIKYKKDRYKEVWDMALNAELQERSYSFGRLLAVADKAESRTYKKEDENRFTNAKRYWSVFAKRPSKTWGIIYGNLIPYLMKLWLGERRKYEDLIIQITNLFKEDEFSNHPLSENYLLGYACQMEELSYNSNHNETVEESTNREGDDENEQFYEQD